VIGESAEVPGPGVDSAQQIIAEVGATAATFPAPKHLASWMGACPGNEESAGVNYSHRCPKGNRQMRRVLNQAANAAVKAKGTIFNVVYRRLVPRLGHAQAIGAITNRLCRLIWKILHQGIRYEERGATVSAEFRHRWRSSPASWSCSAIKKRSDGSGASTRRSVKRCARSECRGRLTHSIIEHPRSCRDGLQAS